MFKQIRSAFIIASLLICATDDANAQPAAPTKESCKSYVQRFYNWYQSKSAKEPPSDTVAFIKKFDRYALSPNLAKMLAEDEAAQAKAPGEIVGLDFDPFLNTNSDGWEKYIARSVTQKGSNFLVQVYGWDKGKLTPKPVTTPELKFDNGHWTLLDVHYEQTEIPENESLVKILRVLKADRGKPAAH